MSTPITTPLSGILPLVEAQILAVSLNLPTPLASTRIFLVRGKTVPTFQGDQDCLILPGPVVAVDSHSTAEGQFCAILSRNLYITIRTRLALDPSDRDDSWITDPDLGHYVLEEAIITALHDWGPQDGNGNNLTQEDLHFISASDPIEMKGDFQWGQTTLIFSCVYQLQMDNPQNTQAGGYQF